MNRPDKPILRIDKLTVDFLSEGDPVRAVDDVSFDVCPGETLVILARADRERASAPNGHGADRLPAGDIVSGSLCSTDGSFPPRWRRPA